MDCIKMCLICVFMSLGWGGGVWCGAGLGFRNSANLAVD